MAKYGESPASVASAPRTITLAQSHGDFQPGNILVERATDRVLIVDWEYSEQRSYGYDFWVYDLAMRSPAGLADRVRRHQGDGWAASLALLEDLIRLLQEGTSGHYVAPSLAYRQMAAELPNVVGILTQK